MNYISKDNGQFQKAKLRRARRCSRVWSHCGSIPRLLRVTTNPTPTVILSTRGLYPLWLRIAVISAHVEVLRRKQGAYSGIKVVGFLICIGRDAPFGAKPPQAGSHKSLMFPAKGKELFYHKGCKFAFVGVDQIRRRSLRGASTPWFPLFGCASTAETSTPQAFCSAVQGTAFLHASSAQDDQVGERLWMYAWYHFADVKNSKLFSELRCEAKSAYGCIPYITSYRRHLQCDLLFHFFSQCGILKGRVP